MALDTHPKLIQVGVELEVRNRIQINRNHHNHPTVYKFGAHKTQIIGQRLSLQIDILELDIGNAAADQLHLSDLQTGEEVDDFLEARI